MGLRRSLRFRGLAAILPACCPRTTSHPAPGTVWPGAAAGPSDSPGKPALGNRAPCLDRPDRRQAILQSRRALNLQIDTIRIRTGVEHARCPDADQADRVPSSREIARAAWGDRGMHPRLSREYQADTTAFADPCPWARPCPRSRPWPSAQSARSRTGFDEMGVRLERQGSVSGTTPSPPWLHLESGGQQTEEGGSGGPSVTTAGHLDRKPRRLLLATVNFIAARSRPSTSAVTANAPTSYPLARSASTPATARSRASPREAWLLTSHRLHPSTSASSASDRSS